MTREAFEIYDPETGAVLYESSDPPSNCSGWYGPCGDCDGCATMRAPDRCQIRPARPWTPWPSSRADWCRWCSAGRYLPSDDGERCERCNDHRSGEGRSWAVGEDPLQGHMMIACGIRTMRPADLVTFYDWRGTS